jgi:hypothetical protein
LNLPVIKFRKRFLKNRNAYGERPKMAARMPVSVLAKQGCFLSKRALREGLDFNFDGKIIKKYASDGWS